MIGAQPCGATPIADLGGLSAYHLAMAASFVQRSSLFLAAEIEVYAPGAAIVLPPAGIGSRPVADLQQLAVQASAEILRASDVGYRTSAADRGGVQVYDGRIATAYALDRAIDLDPAQPAKGVSWGSLSLSNADARFDGYVTARNNDSRPVRMLMGRKTLDTQRGLWLDPAYSDLVPFWAGVASPWLLTDTTLQIPLRDASYLLERTVQQSTFGGTGGLDGTTDLAGKCVPVLRGTCLAITPVLVDPVDYIYRVSDGPISGVTLYVGGDSMNFSYAGDVADATAQQPAPGTYLTSNAQGLIRLGSKPILAVTVDATGAFLAAGPVPTLLAIARTLMTENLGLDPTLVDYSSWLGADAAYPYRSGAFYGTTPANGAAALSALLASIGAKLIPLRTGKLAVLVLRALPPGLRAATTWGTAQIVSLVPQALPATLDPPPYRWRVGYQQVLTVQTSSFDPDVTLAQQQFLGAEYRYATAISLTTKQAYRSPNDPNPLPTALASQADAQAVANDLLALWGQRRRLYTVEVPIEVGIQQEIGGVVILSYPTDDLRGGRAGQIVGESFQSTDATIKFPVLV